MPLLRRVHPIRAPLHLRGIVIARRVRGKIAGIGIGVAVEVGIVLDRDAIMMIGVGPVTLIMTHAAALMMIVPTVRVGPVTLIMTHAAALTMAHMTVIVTTVVLKIIPMVNPIGGIRIHPITTISPYYRAFHLHHHQLLFEDSKPTASEVQVSEVQNVEDSKPRASIKIASGGNGDDSNYNGANISVGGWFRG